MTSPASALQGCGCLLCCKEKIGNSNRKSHQQYIDELKLINPNIAPIEEYKDALTPILHKCLVCGKEWYVTPANALWGYGCPQCNESHGERQVRLWLEKNNISYEFQMKFEDCKDINPLPFDFYLPNYNIAIEYDGKQHFEPIEYFGGIISFERTVKHDNIKNEYCKNNGILLLRIPYFKNVEEELNNFLFI
jgi:very-short-patch-repair endonuclease